MWQPKNPRQQKHTIWHRKNSLSVLRFEPVARTLRFTHISMLFSTRCCHFCECVLYMVDYSLVWFSNIFTRPCQTLWVNKGSCLLPTNMVCARDVKQRVFTRFGKGISVVLCRGGIEQVHDRSNGLYRQGTALCIAGAKSIGDAMAELKIPFRRACHID